MTGTALPARARVAPRFFNIHYGVEGYQRFAEGLR
jgi:hypothetical protein